MRGCCRVSSIFVRRKLYDSMDGIDVFDDSRVGLSWHWRSGNTIALRGIYTLVKLSCSK